MVITESDRDSKSSPPSDSANLIDNSSSPPAYYPNPGRSTANIPPRSPQMLLVRPSIKTGEPAGKRFLKAFCVAAVIYLLLGGIVQISYKLAQRHVLEGVPQGPQDSDGRVVQCSNDGLRLQANQQQSPMIFPPYSSTFFFSVPVSSSLLFLFSRGSYDHGSSVRVELSDKSGDEIEIEVVLSYYNNRARERAQVCLLERDEGGKGIGFFTPRRFYSDITNSYDQVKFTTTIRLPRSGSAKHPLVINAFETQMGSWSHYISSFEDSVVFRSISFHGSNSPIRVNSVSADFAKFKTSNSPITGSYNVSDSLILETSNSPITVNVRLENRDGHKPTLLELKTSNGRIQAPITLISTDDSASTPAAFSVSARTSNNALDISFPEAPSSLFSHLDFSGKTSNSPANVKLHPTYEGSISLKTSSMFTPTLVQRPGSQDPSGQGRHRNVDVRRLVRGSLSAAVWWGDDSNKGEGKGTVEVKTSNSNVVVELG